MEETVGPTVSVEVKADAVMNWWTLRCRYRFGEARERQLDQPGSTPVDALSIPTLEADFTRVLSDRAYINQDNLAFLTLLLHPHLHVVPTQASRQSAPPSPSFKHR